MRQTEFLQKANEWLKDPSNSHIGIDPKDTNPHQRNLCIYILGGWAVNRYVPFRETEDLDIITTEKRLASIVSHICSDPNIRIDSSPDYNKDFTRKYTIREGREIFSIESRFFNDDEEWFKNGEIKIDKDWLFYGSDLFSERTFGAMGFVRIPSRFKLIALKILSCIERSEKDYDKIYNVKKVVKDFSDVLNLLSTVENVDKYFKEIGVVMDQINLTKNDKFSLFFERLKKYKEEIEHYNSGKKIKDDSIIYDFQQYGTNNFDKYIAKNKVYMLNWNELTPIEKEECYKNFERLTPKVNKPHYPTVSLKRQEELNIINNINLDPLINLLNHFSIFNSDLKLPINSKEYDSIHSQDLIYAKRIYDGILNKNSKNGAENNSYFRELWNYLSMREECKNTSIDETDWDVTIVPGCRSDITFRAEKAYETHLKHGVQNIIITGMHPYYDSESNIQITEAEAMHYVLSKKFGQDNLFIKNNIHIENRARNTRENIVHSIPILQDLARQKGKKLRILLVTSPYHMRRFHCLVEKGLSEFDTIVEKIGTIVSNSFFDREKWYLESELPNKFSDDYGLTLHLQEYFKLIGGRATGEF